MLDREVQMRDAVRRARLPDLLTALDRLAGRHDDAREVRVVPGVVAGSQMQAGAFGAIPLAGRAETQRPVDRPVLHRVDGGTDGGRYVHCVVGLPVAERM